MLSTVTVAQFVRRATTGRTGPALIICETSTGETVELFCKFSNGCDEGVINLAREVIAACLAADLGLPIPRPYLVDIPADFADVVGDADYRNKIKLSSSVAFGSSRASNGFSIWTKGTGVSANALLTAAGVFAFDAIIQNSDRRDDNPNCLMRGDEIRIIDHELAFATDLILSWTPPWELNGLSSLETPGHHIFREGLRRREIQYDVIRDKWVALSDACIAEYESAIPPAWSEAGDKVKVAVKLITDARDNIDGCLTEIRRVLQ